MDDTAEDAFRRDAEQRHADVAFDRDGGLTIDYLVEGVPLRWVSPKRWKALGLSSELSFGPADSNH